MTTAAPRQPPAPELPSALIPRTAWPVPTWPLPILLVPLALVVNGYHPWAGDAGIYIAGVRHILNPALYPVNAVFVTAFTRLSLFAHIVAAAKHLTRLPLPWLLLAAYLFSIWLLLEAARRLAQRLFSDAHSPICAVLLMAGCFALPIAGTALFIADPYLTARSFSTPLSLFAVVACLDHDQSGSWPRAWLRTTLLLAVTAFLHPLMAVYTAAFIILLALIDAGHTRLALTLCAAGVASSGIAFTLAHGVTAAYRQCVSLLPRTFLFLSRWRWFEVLGLILPLLLLAASARRSAGRTRALCQACLLLGLSAILIAAFFVPQDGPYLLVPLQVLRSFHLIYAVGIVLCGGVLAKLVQRSRLAASAVLALLFAGMFFAQTASWPGSNRIEWPGLQPSNPWEQAFLWIRRHTPQNAVFAFDPRLDYQPGEDEQGFRAIAERDQLADDKDAGVAAVLPSLAPRWARQRNAELAVDGMSDAQRLAALTPLGANWLLLPPGAKTALPCPYRNGVVQVCRMLPR